MGRRPGRKSGTKEKTIKYFDYTLLFVIIFLVCFGLVMLYSTSSYNAQIEYGDGTHYLKRQAFACCLGFAAMFVISKIDYHVWKKLYGVAYIGAFLLCVSVIFLGSNGNGSTRWFRLGPLSFQPSEFAKLAVIIFLATVISRMQKKIGDLKELMKVMVLLLPLVGPVAYTNLSTAIIIVGIAVAMAFVASPKYAQFVGMAIAVFAFGAVFIVLASYRAERIKIWLHPENYDKGYQTMQGLYAIGSGGLFGKGLGRSVQKTLYLPEPQNDFIYAIIGEEIGYIGLLLLLLAYLLLIWRCVHISMNAPDLFGTLLGSGITIMLAVQVIMNVMVVTSMLPPTGIILPFISWGGNALLIFMGAMGIMLNISRQMPR